MADWTASLPAISSKRRWTCARAASGRASNAAFEVSARHGFGGSRGRGFEKEPRVGPRLVTGHQST
eukprot:7343231-Prymnesium_polylepis.1